MNNGLTRRDALTNLVVGAACATGVLALAGDAAASKPTSGAPATPSVLPVGLAAGGFSVVHAARSRGALRVKLAAADGDAFVALVCAHDPAVPGLATRGGLDVFLENQGQGDTPTVERHGLSAMALIVALDPFRADLSGLSTLAARQAGSEVIEPR